jgi:photosystem II stability/assembly factor-like uncharacterized protein
MGQGAILSNERSHSEPVRGPALRLTSGFAANSRHAVVLVILVLACAAAAEPPLWTSVGPDGGAVRSLVIDPSDSRRLFAGTIGGVFVSTDRGGHWSPSSEGLHLSKPQEITEILFDADDPLRLFANVYGGKIHRSDDGGQTWTRLAWSALADLVVVPGYPERLLAASGWTRVSTDGGWNWRPVRASGETQIYCLAVDPSGSGTVWGGNSNPPVVKSTDGGFTWRDASSGIGPGPITAIAVDPNASEIVYAGTSLGPYKTTDGGGSWRPANVGIGSRKLKALAFDPSDSKILYASAAEGPGQPRGVFRSHDGGATWVAADAGLPVVVVWALAVDPDDSRVVYAGTDVGVYKSVDSGMSWSPSSRGLAAFDVTDVEVIRPTTATFFVSTNGRGIHVTRDGGGSWVEANQGLTDQRALSVVVDPSDTRTVYAGTVRGVFKSTSAGVDWRRSSEGLYDHPVISLVIDAVDSRALLAALFGGGVFRSGDSAQSWVPSSTWILISSSADRIIEDPARGGIAHLFGLHLHRTQDGGDDWEVVPVVPNLAASVGAIAQTNGDLIWLGAHQLVRTRNGGATWEMIRVPHVMDYTAEEVTAMAIDPVDPRIVYLGTTFNGVFLTVDDGVSWMPIKSGQMCTQATVLALAPDEPRTVLIGTEGSGVFALRWPTRPQIVTECPITWWAGGPARSLTLSAVGGTPPYRWSIVAGGVPPGLTLAASTGVISGEPEAEGEWAVTVQLTDSAASSATSDCSIRVLRPLQIESRSLPEGTAGSPYSQALVVSGGLPPYLWSTTDDRAYENGLAMDRDGNLSGILKGTEVFRIPLEVTDATGQKVTGWVEIPVKARVPRRHLGRG